MINAGKQIFGTVQEDSKLIRHSKFFVSVQALPIWRLTNQENLFYIRRYFYRIVALNLLVEDLTVLTVLYRINMEYRVSSLIQNETHYS